MTKKIGNKEELVELLEQCGWKKSTIIDNWYTKKDQYFEASGPYKCAYGIKHTVRIEMVYPICVEDSYDPCEMWYHKVIIDSGVTIRLDE